MSAQVNISSTSNANSIAATSATTSAATAQSSTTPINNVDPTVDVTNAARAVWLVRIPEFVKEAWSKMPGDASLGELLVHADGKFSVKLRNDEDVQLESERVPEQYVMSCDAKPGPIEVFSETVEGEFGFEGFVEQRCDMTPVLNAEYGRIMAERRSAVVRDAKRPRVMLDTEKRIVGVGLTKARRTQMEQASLISTKARSNKDRNRVQMPAAELTSKILALFEKTEELPIVDIDHECQQPMNYLKEILSGVAEFVRARKVWVLKPEYRHNDDGKAKLGGGNQPMTHDDDLE